MRRLLLILLLLVVLAVPGYVYLWPVLGGAPPRADSAHSSGTEVDPVQAVLDISVHTEEGLKLLLDRAEELAMRPQVQGADASVVLVLHGPEVEFFSIKNYEKYKDLVDQAARLDAFDIVDVKICQTMMDIQGTDRDDIPAFIEQVPLGTAEIERLISDGYVAF